jgi:DNA-binding transcriptional MerR regulator
MRIGQLAERTGVPVRTIRFYEQTGLLPAPRRTSSGYRHYDEDAVSQLSFVRSAQALGLSLAEIADVLRIRNSTGPPCAFVAELLDAHIQALDAKIGELTTLRDELRVRRPPGAEPDPARCHTDQVCYLIEDDPPVTCAESTQTSGTRQSDPGVATARSRAS